MFTSQTMHSIPHRGVFLVVDIMIAFPVPRRQRLQSFTSNNISRKTLANLAAVEPDLRVAERLVDSRSGKYAPKAETGHQRPQLPVSNCCRFEEAHHKLIFHGCTRDEFSKSVCTHQATCLVQACLRRCVDRAKRRHDMSQSGPSRHFSYE